MAEVLEPGSYIILSAADINLTVGVPQVNAIPPGKEVEVAVVTEGFNKIWEVTAVRGGNDSEYTLEILVSPTDRRFYAQSMFEAVWVNSLGPSEKWTIKRHGFDTYTVQSPMPSITPTFWTLGEDKANSAIFLRLLGEDVPAKQLWKFVKVPLVME